jgi:hypothetical protein
MGGVVEIVLTISTSAQEGGLVYIAKPQQIYLAGRASGLVWIGAENLTSKRASHYSGYDIPTARPALTSNRRPYRQWVSSKFGSLRRTSDPSLTHIFKEYFQNFISSTRNLRVHQEAFTKLDRIETLNKQRRRTQRYVDKRYFRLYNCLCNNAPSSLSVNNLLFVKINRRGNLYKS